MGPEAEVARCLGSPETPVRRGPPREPSVEPTPLRLPRGFCFQAQSAQRAFRLTPEVFEGHQTLPQRVRTAGDGGSFG